MERENTENNYLFVDDMIDINEKPIPKELLENMPAPQRGNVTRGTFGTFRQANLKRLRED